jgi:drug/metabolite transporter superfamily protein YnfA
MIYIKVRKGVVSVIVTIGLFILAGLAEIAGGSDLVMVKRRKAILLRYLWRSCLSFI